MLHSLQQTNPQNHFSSMLLQLTLKDEKSFAGIVERLHGSAEAGAMLW